MIPVENLVYDLVPDLANKAKRLCVFISNDTTVSTLHQRYMTWVVGQSTKPKNFDTKIDGKRLEELVEHLLNKLQIKYRYTHVVIQNTSFKKFEILRGREVEVLDDIAMDDFELQVASKYKQLLQSARSRSLPFNLTLSDIRKLLRRKTCFFTQVKFGQNELARSIDRLDCDKGYVKGNVVPCTLLVNQMKEHYFEHKGHDRAIRDKLFYRYYMLIAEGKIK